MSETSPTPPASAPPSRKETDVDLRILDAIHHKLALIAKVQAMRGANETRRARGEADAYEEDAFLGAVALADLAIDDAKGDDRG